MFITLSASPSKTVRNYTNEIKYAVQIWARFVAKTNTWCKQNIVYYFTRLYCDKSKLSALHIEFALNINVRNKKRLGATPTPHVMSTWSNKCDQSIRCTRSFSQECALCYLNGNRGRVSVWESRSAWFLKPTTNSRRKGKCCRRGQGNRVFVCISTEMSNKGIGRWIKPLALKTSLLHVLLISFYMCKQ